MQLLVAGQKMFKGNVSTRAVSLDQRIYLSALIDGLIKKGMPMRKTRLSSGDLPALAEQFDLIVDCSGKIGPLAAFPLYEEMKPAPSAPQRVCSAGFFLGLTPDETSQMNYNILPGLGELFEVSTMTEHGLARSLLLEAVPGSELDRIKGDKGPAEFADSMRGVLETYFPHIFERIQPGEFRLTDDRAYARVAIKPEVRVPYTMLGSTLVIGCGDSVALNDPITGQGANAASYCADVLHQVLAEHHALPWDESIGQIYWDRTKEYVVKMSEWTNAMMGPPSDSFSAMLGRATQD